MSVIVSVEQAALVVRGTAASQAGRRVLVGIAGSPGSGKSTVAAALVSELGPGAVLLPMDGFHLPQARLVELGRRERMGAPDTFDVDGFVAILEALRRLPTPNAGDSVFAPGFDRDIEEAVPGAIEITPALGVVVVEGSYLLLENGGWERIVPLLDATMFVRVARDIRLARLIARHEQFGKTGADARAWSLGPDEANAVLVEASAGRADHELRLG